MKNLLIKRGSNRFSSGWNGFRGHNQTVTTIARENPALTAGFALGAGLALTQGYKAVRYGARRVMGRDPHTGAPKERRVNM